MCVYAEICSKVLIQDCFAYNSSGSVHKKKKTDSESHYKIIEYISNFSSDLLKRLTINSMSINRQSEAILRSFVEREPYDVNLNLPLEPADENQNNAEEEPDDGESGYESDIEPRAEVEENSDDYSAALVFAVIFPFLSGPLAEIKNDNMQYFDRRNEFDGYVGNLDSVQDKSPTNGADRAVDSAQDRFYYSGLTGGGYAEKGTDDKESGSDGESEENNRSRSVSGRARVEAEYPSFSGSNANDGTPATVSIALASDDGGNGELRHSDTDSETTDVASCARRSKEYEENNSGKNVTDRATEAVLEDEAHSCEENNLDETPAEVSVALTNDTYHSSELRHSHTDSEATQDADVTSYTHSSLLENITIISAVNEETNPQAGHERTNSTWITTTV